MFTDGDTSKMKAFFTDYKKLVEDDKGTRSSKPLNFVRILFQMFYRLSLYKQEAS